MREHIKNTIAQANLGAELKSTDLDQRLAALRTQSGDVTAKQQLAEMKAAAAAKKASHQNDVIPEGAYGENHIVGEGVPARAPCRRAAPQSASASTMTGRTQSSDDKPQPPYAKYAFKNPYNYAIMGGFASAALLTGSWWLGLAGAGAEALWMLFAPDSRLLRKLWFDKRHAEDVDVQRKAELDAKFKLLPEPDAMRCLALREKQNQINSLAQENPAFTLDLLTGELQKLDDLVRAFLELSVTCARYQDYLGSIDIDEIERDLRRYHQILDQGEGVDRGGKRAQPGAEELSSRGESRRTLAQKNIAVLDKRKEKYAEIRSYLSSARGQLELIENSFRLLADQIVTMRSPTELSGQLDDLLDGVEAVRQTTRETDKLLQAVER